MKILLSFKNAVHVSHTTENVHKCQTRFSEKGTNQKFE